MFIRDRLKELDVKLYRFAKDLMITRPTLNNYIDMYDKNEQIPKEKYQFIFDKLFDDGIESREEFEEELSRIHYLLERDIHIGALELDVSRTDLMTSVLDNVRDDLAKDDYNEHVFKFINMLITSYRREPVFIDFINYFLYLNSVKSIDEIKDKDKPFLSNCFKLLHDDREGILKTDNEYYEFFVNRISTLKEESVKRSKKKAESALKRKVKEEVNKKIKEQLALGVDVDEIDYDEIISSIDFTKN